MAKLIDQILLLSNEDYCGLWEVYEEAKYIYGNLPQDDLILQSRRAILNLIELNWIQLFFCEEPLTNESVKKIPCDEVSHVLDNRRYWLPPEKGAISVRFLSTSTGENAFAERFLD